MQKMFDMNLRLIKRQMIMMIPAILLLAAGAKMIYQTTYYSDISDWGKSAAAAVTAVAAAAILFLILYEAHLLFHRTVFGHDSNLYMALPVRTKNLIASKILAVWVQTAAVQLCTFLMFLYPWESQYIPRLIEYLDAGRHADLAGGRQRAFADSAHLCCAGYGTEPAVFRLCLTPYGAGFPKGSDCYSRDFCRVCSLDRIAGTAGLQNVCAYRRQL